VLVRDLSKTACDKRQSPRICFSDELFIRVTAAEYLAGNNVLRAVFNSQLEASLNPVGGTREIAVTRATHRPERSETFDTWLEGPKESSEPIKLVQHWKRTRFSLVPSCV